MFSWIIITVNIVSVSSQTIDSTKFVFHKVVKNETSYGIAKKYEISLNDFFLANPNASSGISKGEIVKIPFKFFENKDKIFEYPDSTVDVFMEKKEGTKILIDITTVKNNKKSFKETF